ncbi:DUF1489 domain-containing protein [Ferrovibrio sp.]|uniref:DUF1489 family protein n=1 Tax=Ferrovibrio sp. TaxID=1917215 RepID=UPI0025B99C30|nr:DUF1489 domain-containing protein [Ferrovibrio sp.]MBX3454071.1 DUF1489 domain-containing protein [Ferrovibrio sp.]
MPVHLLKLAVGVESVEDFRQRLKQRAKDARGKKPGSFTHITRHRPKRDAEVLDGGSLYWIVKGQLCVRTRILALDEVKLDDGLHCAIKLEAKLIPVLPQPRRPHQGWRYLEAEDAPPDVAQAGEGTAKLPDKLLRELREAGLL